MTRLIKILFKKVVEVLENEYEETKKQAGNCCLEAQVGNPRGFDFWAPDLLVESKDLNHSTQSLRVIKNFFYFDQIYCICRM